MALIEGCLLRAVQTVTSDVSLILLWILVHVLLEATSLRSIAVGYLGRWPILIPRLLLVHILR